MCVTIGMWGLEVFLGLKREPSGYVLPVDYFLLCGWRRLGHVTNPLCSIGLIVSIARYSFGQDWGGDGELRGGYLVTIQAELNSQERQTSNS